MGSQLLSVLQHMDSLYHLWHYQAGKICIVATVILELYCVPSWKLITMVVEIKLDFMRFSRIALGSEHHVMC